MPQGDSMPSDWAVTEILSEALARVLHRRNFVVSCGKSWLKGQTVSDLSFMARKFLAVKPKLSRIDPFGVFTLAAFSASTRFTGIGCVGQLHFVLRWTS